MAENRQFGARNARNRTSFSEKWSIFWWWVVDEKYFWEIFCCMKVEKKYFSIDAFSGLTHLDLVKSIYFFCQPEKYSSIYRNLRFSTKYPENLDIFRENQRFLEILDFSLCNRKTTVFRCKIERNREILCKIGQFSANFLSTSHRQFWAWNPLKIHNLGHKCPKFGGFLANLLDFETIFAGLPSIKISDFYLDLWHFWAKSINFEPNNPINWIIFGKIDRNWAYF